jgi:glutaredoxin 3
LEEGIAAIMAEVIIYATKFCPYCISAKKLLRRKGVRYKEIDVTFNPGLRAEMTKKAGGRHTVPQIFINGRHVGGCDDLYALEEKGQLDPLLKQAR